MSTAISVISSRPWGFYEILDEFPGVLIKRITIFPGQRLSLQSHKHRKEIWTIISGTGTVQVGNLIREISAGEIATVHAGDLHRASANVHEHLIIIEVQIGEILIEEDIFRVEDDYGRVSAQVVL
jgi:mannose-6-phosphate isomerase-like protein (cupin superfamily)